MGLEIDMATRFTLSTNQLRVKFMQALEQALEGSTGFRKLLYVEVGLHMGGGVFP